MLECQALRKTHGHVLGPGLGRNHKTYGKMIPTIEKLADQAGGADQGRTCNIQPSMMRIRSAHMGCRVRSFSSAVSSMFPLSLYCFKKLMRPAWFLSICQSPLPCISWFNCAWTTWQHQRNELVAFLLEAPSGNQGM